jgi:hypothetical protein
MRNPHISQDFLKMARPDPSKSLPMVTSLEALESIVHDKITFPFLRHKLLPTLMYLL